MQRMFTVGAIRANLPKPVLICVLLLVVELHSVRVPL